MALWEINSKKKKKKTEKGDNWEKGREREGQRETDRKPDRNRFREKGDRDMQKKTNK